MGVLHRLTLTAKAKDGHDRLLFDKLLRCLVSSPIFVRCQRLIARKIAELFSSNRAMSQFYEACGIDDVSRGSVSCLFAAIFEGAIFTVTTFVVCAETDDPGCRPGDTVQIVTRWWHPVASNVLHRAMCSILQQWIAKDIETASIVGAFVCNRRFVVMHNLSYTTLLWSIKNKAEPYYWLLL